jgi:hypothetical protein
MTESIAAVSRSFFFEIIKPIMEREFPLETSQTAFGLFGYGSEAYGLERADMGEGMADEYSSDHHWGIRINALMPEYLYRGRQEEFLDTVQRQLPATYRGQPLREGLSGGAGLSLTSLEGYLRRTIGLDRPPETHEEWLQIPEEDILHVINGEIWHDESGCFSALRRSFGNYYPEPVRLRKIAHWCRYFSGMGTYALKRAILRDNEYYATITFSRALRWGVQLAFMLDRQFYPYDKWTMAYFRRLPRLAEPLLPLVEEAVDLATPWERKLALLHAVSDMLDETMVADGIIQPHPRFRESPTSGYRLLEHAYAEILRGLPPELRTAIPVWDQVHFESFHAGYVVSLPVETWDGLLNLAPEDGQ